MRQFHPHFALGLLLGLCVFSGPGVRAAESIPVNGCVIVELTDTADWPLDAWQDNGWKSGDKVLDEWLETIKARSLRQEYGSLLPGYRVLRYPDNLSTETVLMDLLKRDDVAHAWGNVAFPLSELTHTPNDPLIPAQWHLQAIHATRGFALSGGSEEVVIGIIDSGVHTTHPDLAASMWINSGEDLNGDGIWDPEVDADGVDNDGNGYVDDGIGWDWVDVGENNVFPGEDHGPPDNDPSDFNGHGTHCAGDAAAITGNGVGVASPGAGCRVAALRAGWATTTGQGVVGLSEATSAIAYAVEHGFSVVSMSFGGSGGDPQYFTAGMQAAHEAGLLMVAAAGNEASTTPHFPAAEPFVIAVAATNSQNRLSGFSNRGNWITISAPGSFIYSTTNGGGYGAMSGTSMACPVTAGAIASLRSLAPDWTYQQIVDRLYLTATPMSDIGSGAGLLNMGALLDPFVSVDSVGITSASGPRITHNQLATLHLRFAKLEGYASGCTVQLSAENPRVTLGTDTLQLGDLAGTTNVTRQVTILVDGNGVELEEIVLQARISGLDAISGDFDYTQPVYLQVGRGELLLIDADEGGQGRLDLWYTAPLNELGLAVSVVRLDEISDLAAELEGFRGAILATGSRTTSPFREGEIAIWSDYLEQGGNWLLTGQNIAEALSASDPQALDTLFHVALTAPHSNRLVARGFAEEPLTEGVSLILAGDGGAQNQTSLDVLDAGPGAEPLFVYTHDTPEELAGVRVQRGQGELIFCGFGLEAVNDSISTGTSRTAWFDRLFRAWSFEVGLPDEQGEVSVPAGFTLGNAWPNPTNGTVTLPFTLPHAGAVQVRVVDRLGREVTSWTHRSYAGSNRIAWEMPEELASGVYLISLTAGKATATTRVVLVK